MSLQDNGAEGAGLRMNLKVGVIFFWWNRGLDLAMSVAYVVHLGSIPSGTHNDHWKTTGQVLRKFV